MLTNDGRQARADWTLTADKIHLNHGSFGAVPRVTQIEQRRYRDEMESNPCSWFTGLPDRLRHSRSQIAAFLRVSPERLALVHNASAGMSTVLNALVTEPGAEIIATNHGYGAVVEGARRAARRVGGTLRTLEFPLAAEPDSIVTAVAEAISTNTRLIVVDQVTSATARTFPVDDVMRVAAAHAVPVVVDGAHAAGVLERPVPQGAGFWVGNLHKFACAPRGTAALVATGTGADDLTPLIDSWGFPDRFPRNFDHVGTQDVTAWVAANTAFQFIADNYGWDTFRSYSEELCDYGESVIADAFGLATGQDARVDVGMPVGPMRLVRLPAGIATSHEEALQVRQFLSGALDIETAITTFNGIGYLRISAHLYNTREDYDTFVDRAVPALVELSRRTG